MKKFIAIFTCLTFALLVAGPVSADFTSGNYNTGFGSTNESESEEENDLDVFNTNFEDLLNLVTGTGNSGGNVSDSNTGVGSVLSGAVNVGGPLLNNINDNYTGYFDSWTGDFSATNDTTGALSDNEAESELENDIDVDNDNGALVNNIVNGTGNTGNNSASMNTGSGSGDVGTGSATVLISESNNVNLNDSEFGFGMTSESYMGAYNSVTGYDSDNEAEAGIDNEVDVDNNNWVDLWNNATGMANTGGNNADSNTGLGSVLTGTAGAVSLIDNLVNYNSVSVIALFGNSPFGGEAINNTTGALSGNEAEVEVENEFDFDNDNNAWMENVANSTANTGGNSASQNTGSTGIDSGNAVAGVGIYNAGVNTNVGSATINFGNAELFAKNAVTGANSNNEAEVEVENELDFVNTNNSMLNNTGTATANTGGNNANQNTNAGSVPDATVTGDALAGITIDNGGSINENITDVIIGYGESMFSAINSVTGALSDNEAEVEVENEVDVDNNNFSDLFNMANATANTGNNKANQNTGEGNIATGDATAEGTVDNDVNVNVTTISLGTNDNDFFAENNTTGADSTNEAEASLENDVDVDNNNESWIDNIVNLTSNSGGNTANQNTGSGNVTTGAVDVDFGVSNNANSNTTEVGDLLE